MLFLFPLHRMRKPIFITILIVLLLNWGCGHHSHPDKKIFRYNESSGITSLDPLKATNLSNIWAVQQIFEGLMFIDSIGQIKPLLVSDWDVNDSLTKYTFRLKDNIYFHDDICFKNQKRKLVASDVQYSYERVINSSSGWILNNIAYDSIHKKNQIEVIDSFQLVIHLKNPSASFPQMLAMQPCGIVPKEALDMYGDDFRRHPVGTGPFCFFEWHENERLIFHKNVHYHQPGMPIIDGVSISFLKDKQTALLEFIRGNFDLISGIDAAYKDELLLADGTLNPKYHQLIRLEKSPYLNTEYLGILLDSTSNSPLQNIHIRKALNYGLNKDKLIQYLRNGVGTAGSSGIVPPALFNNKKLVNGYSYNLARFKEEIKAAGYSRIGEVPTIKLSTDVAYADVCTYIINQWNELGLHVELEVLDRPTLKSEIAKGNISFFRASWIADYPDPENYLSLFYSPMKSPIGPNYTHFNNSQYDEIFEQSAMIISDSLRYGKYMELDQLMMEESPVIILYYDQAVRFINRRIQGLSNHPMNYLDLKRLNIIEQ